MKFFIGPMSKNVVDTILDFCNTYDIDIVFIPSRRQIECTGGYVNNWTTEEFYKYIQDSPYKRKTILERDHGGPGQGQSDDDGLQSLEVDSKYMNIIHIDPWKKYPKYQDGLAQTVQMIQYVFSKNPTIEFEVGTEQGIRPLSVEELDALVCDLRLLLTPKEYKQIKYLVIQCGTQLLEKTNIGDFDPEKLTAMLAVCSKHNLIAKEHNGDWVDTATIQKKAKLGLTCINIAPEFGEIETCVLLNKIKQNPSDFETFYRICLDSGKWKKWVSPSFNPDENKETLIKICGHYVFADPEFQQLKQNYGTIDTEIQKTIKFRLMELHGLFYERKQCILCNSSNMDLLLQDDTSISTCYSLFPEKTKEIFIPYNIQYCSSCSIAQIKYVGDLDLVYSTNHIDNFGQVKHNMHTFFADFILKNTDIRNTIEIGACHDYLSRLLQNANPALSITVIDPSFTGNTDNITVIPNFVEQVDLTIIPANTVILSSVFEHFYNPIEILNIFKNSNNIEYIYLNHPNMDYAVQNDVHINLTAEHTFYIPNDKVTSLFTQYGFQQTRINYFENHTICYEFKRSTNAYLTTYTLLDTYKDITKYLQRIKLRVDSLNTLIQENPNAKFYLWPASMHIVPLFTHGLHYTHLEALLDNSPNKIGKYFYGYNILCQSFDKVIQSSNEDTYILLGGAENYRKELNLTNFKGKLYTI